MSRLFTEYELAGAEFNVTRSHRYSLHRIWNAEPSDRFRVTVLWIMLNPSTADEHVLDPTLRKCQSFSKRWGYDGFEVCNLFALRSTDPDALLVHLDPVGEENDRYIAQAVEGNDLIVCGWGNHKAAHARARQVMTALRVMGATPKCLGVNQDGSPRHPLYIPYTQPLEDFTL